MIGPFREKFGSTEGFRLFRAPGRVNLIGEHTDYNLGFVLPVALEMACYTGSAPAPDARLRVYSRNQDQTKEWDIGAVASLEPSRHWTDYVIGVAQQLIKAGYDFAPTNLYIDSTVPEGGGLSSSAALEVSSALALLRGRSIPPLELARLCQRAEREFVGMPCGIMDQYISVFGKAHAAIKIDCRSLESEAVDLPEVDILAVNTMVKHELGQSAYRDRVRECAAAAAAMGAGSLRDATPEQLEAAKGAIPEVVYRRARHVITEDQRVIAFIEASHRADLPAMGRLFIESHRSLQHDYEVSCEELDFLVDTALTIEGVFGARMTGGGFGGCTVNLVRSGRSAAFREEIACAYQRHFSIEPQIYECRPAAGAGEVEKS